MTKAVSTDGVRAVVYLSWENGQSFDYHHSSSAARAEYIFNHLKSGLAADILSATPRRTWGPWKRKML
jgi:hypothetical protein